MNLDKLQKAFEQFINMYNYYQEHINDMESLSKDAVKESLAQRFEYCTEVFWKILKRHLEVVEGLDVKPSPKDIIRHAGVLDILDSQKWIGFINARQLVAHDYDSLKLDIVLSYMDDFAEYGQKLLTYLEEHNEN